MMQGDRRLLWHPRLDDKFLVGGGSQITLYEWASDTSEIRQVTSKQDLTTMKVPLSHVLLSYTIHIGCSA